MISVCKEVETHLAEFVAGQGEAKTRDRLQAHLENCARCRALAQEQTAIRHQLRLLSARDAKQTPPQQIWERAAHAWNIRDGHEKNVGRLRLALAGGTMLVFLLSVVWAKVTNAHEFPVEVVMRNFREIKAHKPVPAYRTNDPDNAARWLRERLHAELPPVNLALSRSELIGADVITTQQQNIGRLLYRTPLGITALYLAPGTNHFARTSQLSIGRQTFYLRDSVDVGMYGWAANAVGYGMLLSEPAATRQSLAINAAHATEEKEVQ